MSFIVYLGLAYLLGSIPNGYIVGKLLKGIDIREHGSKNIGATNAARVLGKKWGILVFLLDALKGFLAVWIPKLSPDAIPLFLVLFAITAILGHSFTCWLNFKGGKGVATSLGVFLALIPIPTLITFSIWIVVFFITHIISISSLVAAVIFPIACLFTLQKDAGFYLYLLVSLLLAIFMFYTHRANIERLKKGQEKKLF